MYMHNDKLIVLQCPRPEAVSILGGLTCFPNHFTEFQVIDSNYLMLKKLQSKDFKVLLSSNFYLITYNVYTVGLF